VLALTLVVMTAGATVASRPATGTLSISSDPTAATVYVDGGFIGQTPVDIPNLQSGDHRVRVVKDGYLENSRIVKIGGASETLKVRLTVRAAQTASATAGLKIVVIAGEGAVNIIQQKTAVAPIVEVRDRNDVPVGGAVVTFAIGGKGAAFAGNVQTLTITTNAAGRAGATSLSPLGAGNVKISVDAAFQGQTASVSISQINFVTVAAAKAAGAVVGASSGGAAAGAGGGLSLTTIGIVAGAAAGGAVVTKKVLGGGGPAMYKGPFRVEAVQSNHQTQSGTVTLSCVATVAYLGTLSVNIDERDGTVTGEIVGQYNATEFSTTCPFSSVNSENLRVTNAVTGTTGNLQATGRQVSPDGVGISAQSFAGALNGSVITGTWTMSYGYKTIPTPNGFFSDGTFPTASATVTLQKE
jgi:hypothetical protein